MTKRKVGRPKKNENDKRVIVSVSDALKNTEVLRIAGYSSTKLYQFIVQVINELWEKGEEVDSLKSRKNLDFSKDVEKVVAALIKDKENERIRLEMEAHEAIEQFDKIKTSVIETLCRIRFDIFDGKNEGKIVLRSLVSEYPDLLSFKEVTDFLSMDDEIKHARKSVRTKEEIREHYSELLQSPILPPELQFLMEKEESNRKKN